MFLVYLVTGALQMFFDDDMMMMSPFWINTQLYAVWRGRN